MSKKESIVESVIVDDSIKLNELLKPKAYKVIKDFLDKSSDEKLYTAKTLSSKLGIALNYLKSLDKEPIRDYRVNIKGKFYYGNPKLIKKLKEIYGND